MAVSEGSFAKTAGLKHPRQSNPIAMVLRMELLRGVTTFITSFDAMISPNSQTERTERTATHCQPRMRLPSGSFCAEFGEKEPGPTRRNGPGKPRTPLAVALR